MNYDNKSTEEYFMISSERLIQLALYLLVRPREYHTLLVRLNFFTRQRLLLLLLLLQCPHRMSLYESLFGQSEVSKRDVYPVTRIFLLSQGMWDHSLDIPFVIINVTWFTEWITVDRFCLFIYVFFITLLIHEAYLQLGNYSINNQLLYYSII